jgi:hypothetical protein
MSDGKYQPLTDSMDDLPRTLRREHEARERAAREQQAKAAPGAQSGSQWDRGPARAAYPAAQPAYGTPEAANSYDHADPLLVGAPAKAVVTRFKVPFFSLMGFFIKAVFAAIPALLILIAMLYWLGVGLQTYFPQLIKMKILISFP